MVPDAPQPQLHASAVRSSMLSTAAIRTGPGSAAAADPGEEGGETGQGGVPGFGFGWVRIDSMIAKLDKRSYF
jgi:hypothetical protein